MVNEELKSFTGYIYKITNTRNGKVYIGQTRRTVEKRFKQHLSSAFRESSKSYLTYLSRAIRKYSTECFIVETIKEIMVTTVGRLCKQLDKEEVFYIRKYNSTDPRFGYNRLKGGQLNRSSEELLNYKNALNIIHVGCCVPGCNGVHLANGYCQRHYNQVYTHGHILERTHFDRNNIEFYDDYAEIILYNNNCQEVARTKIDLEDVPKVQEIKWGYHSTARGEGVIAQTPHIAIHNYLLNHTDKSTVVMHKNGNNLDNRKENLVIVSQTEKQQNNKLQSNNTSGHKGVWFCKDRNKWQAQITINNKQKNLGRYNTFEEAVAAREAAEKVYYNKW